MSERVGCELTPDELIARLEQEQNITVSRGTLQRWTRAGLVPTPRTGSYGRGRGRFTLYPEGAVAEATASYALLRHTTLRPTIKAVAGARKLALEQHKFFKEEIPKMSPSEFRETIRSGFDSRVLDERFRQLPYGWLVMFLKARERFPFNKPALAGYVYRNPGDPVEINIDPQTPPEDAPIDGLIFKYAEEAALIIKEGRRR